MRDGNRPSGHSQTSNVMNVGCGDAIVFSTENGGTVSASPLPSALYRILSTVVARGLPSLIDRSHWQRSPGAP